MIALAYRDSLPQGTADELDQLVQGLTGMLYQEHNPDGTHKDITCDSITVDKPDLTNGIAGTIEFQDRKGNVTTIERTDDEGAQVTLSNGLTFLIRRKDLSNTIFNLVRLGTIQQGAGTGNGIALLGPNQALPTTFHDWTILSLATSSGPTLLIGDKTQNVAPVMLRYRSAVPAWEWMKTTGTLGPTTEQVTLGSALDSSLQGYWDAAYIKALYLGTGAGTTTAQIGAWTDVPYSGGNFTGKSSMTWTVTSGEQISYAYALTGASMTLAFVIDVATIGGTPSDTLQIAIPGGFSVAGRSIHTTGWGVDGNGTVLTSIQIRAIVGNAFVSILKWDTTNWTAGASNYVRGEITFAIA